MPAAAISACAVPPPSGAGLAAPAARQAEQAAEAAAAIVSAVKLHGRTVFRIAYLVLRDPAEAEEVAQETFLRAWRQGLRWGQVKRPDAWLARVAWRLALDHSRHRHGAAAAAPLAYEPAAAGADAERQAAARQRLSRVEALIAALPRRLREPLLLSSLEELNSRQIAAALGIPAASVRSRLQRARRLLRQRLGELP